METGGALKVTKGAIVVMRGKREGNLYILIRSTIIDGAVVITYSDSDTNNISTPWHMRLMIAGIGSPRWSPDCPPPGSPRSVLLQAISEECRCGASLPSTLVALLVRQRSVPVSLHHPGASFDHATFVLPENVLIFLQMVPTNDT